MTGRWSAEDIAGELKGVGLPVTAAWVRSRVPGGKRPTPRKPHEWDTRTVERWRKKMGLDRKRRLVRIEELAQILGVSYWTARRSQAPAIVFGHNEKYYEVP